jgi:3-oxoacyl-[acyl-carrier protein] reductase
METKVVLITGATGAIGKATAIAFARAGGYSLALHYNTASSDTREELSKSIQESNSASSAIKVAFFQADLQDYNSVRRLHAAVLNDIGNVDILFNNAGTSSGVSAPESLQSVSLDTFENSWRINVGSGILLAQLCLPHMEAQGWGRIIFDSSVAAFTGGVVGPHYASSKSALHGLVHWLARNVADKGITVNAVAPALIEGAAMLGDVGNPGGSAWSRAAAGMLSSSHVEHSPRYSWLTMLY